MNIAWLAQRQSVAFTRRGPKVRSLHQAPNNSAVAQLVEHSLDKREVAGSTPAGTTKSTDGSSNGRTAVSETVSGGSNPPPSSPLKFR